MLSPSRDDTPSERADFVGPRPRVLIIQADREIAEDQAFHMRIAGLAPAVALDGDDAVDPPALPSRNAWQGDR
jgi:hypothetical protein